MDTSVEKMFEISAKIENLKEYIIGKVFFIYYIKSHLYSNNLEAISD